MDSGQGTAPFRVHGPDVKLHVANLVNTENCNARIACFLFRCREVALGLRKGSVLPISSDQADECVCLKKNPVHDHGAQLGFRFCLWLAESRDPRSNRVNERVFQNSFSSKLVWQATGTPGEEKQSPSNYHVHFIRSFGMLVSGQSSRSFCKSG